jgi:hypothetical protein
VDLYINSPIRRHGALLNWLSTGTTFTAEVTFRVESPNSYNIDRFMYCIISNQSNSTIFSDVTPCSPIEVRQRFGGTHYFQSFSQTSRQQEPGKASLTTWFLTVTCFAYTSNLKTEAVCLPKRRWTSVGVHKVTPQNTVHFIVSAVRTSAVAIPIVGFPSVQTTV